VRLGAESDVEWSAFAAFRRRAWERAAPTIAIMHIDIHEKLDGKPVPTAKFGFRY
jgi:hypothetical protein